MVTHRNNGYHGCITSTYNYGTSDNLNKTYKDKIVFDRMFFDFDTHHSELNQLKNELKKTRQKISKHDHPVQKKLIQKIQSLIISERIAEKSINEAKNFSLEFKKNYGKELALFFSGCKGAHAYTFFKPTLFHNFDETITWLGQHIKKSYKYDTLDLNVFTEASTRKTRIPYTKHQHSQLTVVPFTINDDYDTIIQKALTPKIEPFNTSQYSTQFNKYLLEIDEILTHNKKTQNKPYRHDMALKSSLSNSYVEDHRIFFRELLGPPAKEYPSKEYVMYHCPFPDHRDSNPSFMVHKTRYKCLGCNRNGTYQQFLKEYHKTGQRE